MKSLEHLEENAKTAAVPPLSAADFYSLLQLLKA